MTPREYDEEQQELALEAAQKLHAMAERMRAFMVPHAVAQAFLSVALEGAHRSMTSKQVAAWLAGVAEELADESARPWAH